MRRVFAIIIVLCLAYFLGGWIVVYLGRLSRDTYFTYAGIVGGLASVAGLFALTRPAITRSDVQAIELDTLKSMAETEEQLKSLELARAHEEGQLVSLSEKKKAMELLVKKASLALFLKEQYSHHARQVAEEIGRNSQLHTNLEKATEAAAKLAALNEEIEEDPNVRQLKEIIASASRRQLTLDEAVSELPPVIRGVFMLAQAAYRTMEIVLGRH
jgi:hypothetical protein